jgi:hypothetical protein
MNLIPILRRPLLNCKVEKIKHKFLLLKNLTRNKYLAATYKTSRLRGGYEIFFIIIPLANS